MGFKVTWIVVRGGDPERAAALIGRELDLRETWDAPDGDCVAALPGGWTLVWLNAHVPLDRAGLAGLLDDGPAVACEVNDTVMYGEARGYDATVEVWRIIRDCQDDDDDEAGERRRPLRVTGEPPPSFGDIRRKAYAEQEADDEDGVGGVDFIYDVPWAVAKAVCGFRHDEPPTGVTYIPLNPAPRKPGFFARLFGAR